MEQAGGPFVSFYLLIGAQFLELVELFHVEGVCPAALEHIAVERWVIHAIGVGRKVELSGAHRISVLAMRCLIHGACTPVEEPCIESFSRAP